MESEWSVGYSGPIKITTSLPGEEEIDIDDREAQLTITLEMLATAPYALRAENLTVTLKFDFTGQSIAIGGLQVDPSYQLIPPPGIILRPGVPVTYAVKIETGVFSVTPKVIGTPSATPGRKEVDVLLEYDLVPDTTTGTNTLEHDLTMQFVVAID